MPVYFARSQTAGHVKLGLTDHDTHARVREWFTDPGGVDLGQLGWTRADETDLHRCFSHQQVRVDAERRADALADQARRS